MALQITSALDKSLASRNQLSQIYLMLKLEPDAGVVARIPINIAMVIDASGSMTGEKLRRAKEAASLVVRSLASTDRVAVVAYNDQVRVAAPSTMISAAARNELMYQISRIGTGGTTNLSGGWLTGCQEVASHQTRGNQIDRVLLLTDGLANLGIVNPDELAEHARQLRVRGVSTSTMGIGADFNEELLVALARQGGGRFQYVETVKHIPDCVAGELGEIQQVSARSAALEVVLPDGVEPDECLNDYTTETISGGLRIHLGDILAGNIQRVILKLNVRSENAPRDLSIQTRVMYTDTATGRGTESSVPPVTLSFAGDAEVEAQPVNDEVAREVGLLLSARAKEKAARLVREGGSDAAVANIQAAGRALGESTYANDPAFQAEIAQLQDTALQMRAGLREQQRKDLHYQSYLARTARNRYDK